MINSRLAHRFTRSSVEDAQGVGGIRIASDFVYCWGLHIRLKPRLTKAATCSATSDATALAPAMNGNQPLTWRFDDGEQANDNAQWMLSTIVN